jgi:hypothetical protein
MTTLKYTWYLPLLALALLLLPGCYTQVATYGEEESDPSEEPADYSETDSIGGTTIVNNYFYDDSYRWSRYRIAFQYYHPSIYWYGSFWYDPWFDNPWYWHYPWWYDPYYTVIYPRPYWYPPYGYYGWYDYYPYGYYQDAPLWTGGAEKQGPRRPGGSTRGLPDESPGGRGPIGSTTPPIAVPAAPATHLPATVDRDEQESRTPNVSTGSATPATREPATIDKDPTTTNNGTRQKRDNTPWWQRLQHDGKKAAGTESTPGTGQTPKTGKDQTVDRPTNTPVGGNAPTSSPKQKERTRRPAAVDQSSPPRDHESTPTVSKPKSETPRSSPPPQQSAPPRNETPQYSPPPQQSAPPRNEPPRQSTPAGGERKREDAL